MWYSELMNRKMQKEIDFTEGHNTLANPEGISTKKSLFERFGLKNKRTILFVFLGFLLLKLIIVSMIFIVPRVVEHVRG
jgi:hypothetical protein